MSDQTVIIDVDARPSDSPYVETIWRSRSEVDGDFLSVAASHWEMVITELEGNIHLTVRGPETKSKPAYCPPAGEWLGVVFRLGTYMPHLPTVQLVDTEINLERAGDHTFWLHGAAWEFPTYENVDTFIAKMARTGLLEQDPVVAAALAQHTTDLSLRTVQRRFRHATGLTQGQFSQIERARLAVGLLQQGVPILDVLEMAGYADQPHLTRSLKRFTGQTPAQILSPELAKEMSYVTMTGLVA